MRKTCRIVEDLLPLYHDGVCSDESKQMVEEHLSQCEECRKLLNQIEGELVEPAKETDIKILKGINSKIHKGRKKALIEGALITLIFVLLALAGVSTWWYCHEYTYYMAFVDEDLDNRSNNDEGLKPENRYEWSDSIYEYNVVIPDYLSNGGFIGMSRLDNDDTNTVELAITRWENEKYIFHVFVNDAENVRYFIIDSELNLCGNYSEEQMKTIYEELNNNKEIVQEIINDAIAMWPFIE